jgi:NADH-quinone oxidoreductase subunit L
VDLALTLPLLLGIAWLLPLASFVVILFVGPRMGEGGKHAALLATGAIMLSCLLSFAALGSWVVQHPLPEIDHSHHADAHEAVLSHASPQAITGQWYDLVSFDAARISIGYYIDGLTLAMFCMVTFIASCIHVYSIGYMHDELDELVDHEVTLADGRKLRRRGRFPRFFQYLSLFCFSMLGLVIAGNVAMVFCFWELVGICSYLLIGFYIERRSASTAANKAFIVNRVGDFGMLIGLMVIWTGMGTFSFGDTRDAQGQVVERGIFSQVRPAAEAHNPVAPDGMVRFSARREIAEIVRAAPNLPAAEQQVAARVPGWRDAGYGYGFLVLAGLGIFCGCVGKSAQFPLHVWLPDAMEGPTPVSALIHAATMVAAGVYLVGRFYPVFTPEVLLVIAHIGVVTLFIAATIALTATDIKRVLAYSTVSQLGYMMLALGGGGWLAGLFHLFTHAFFKSLLFLCSGSVIHACHTNDMTQMGGLRKKMPWTAYTMLVGCLAIAGAGVPLLIGLSGYYSKDYIIAQEYVYRMANPTHGWMFYAAVAGAALTSFYMFRLWFMTFGGTPRDRHVYDHAHESPRLMIVPLVVLAALAIGVGWNMPLWNIGLEPLLTQARPVGTGEEMAAGQMLGGLIIPAEHASHAPNVHRLSTLIAFTMAALGFVLALLFYGLKRLDPADVRRQFSAVYNFLVHKWWFDELYQLLFVRPTIAIARGVALLDSRGIDRLIDGLAWLARGVARCDDWFDRTVVDRGIDLTASWTYDTAVRLRRMQTGNLRQYVMLLAIGTVAIFVLMSLYWTYAVAGQIPNQ